MSKDKYTQEEALWQRMEAVVATEKTRRVAPYLATRVMARLDDRPSPRLALVPVLRSAAVALALMLGFFSAHWSSGAQVGEHRALVEAYFQNNQVGLSLEESWLYSDGYEAD